MLDHRPKRIRLGMKQKPLVARSKHRAWWNPRFKRWERAGYFLEPDGTWTKVDFSVAGHLTRLIKDIYRPAFEKSFPLFGRRLR